MVLKKTQRKIQRHYGKDSHLCRVTNNANGVIRKYGLLMTRRCFREQAEHIGFKKVSHPHITPVFAMLSLFLCILRRNSIFYHTNQLLCIVQVNDKSGCQLNDNSKITKLS